MCVALVLNCPTAVQASLLPLEPVLSVSSLVLLAKAPPLLAKHIPMCSQLSDLLASRLSAALPIKDFSKRIVYSFLFHIFFTY